MVRKPPKRKINWSRSYLYDREHVQKVAPHKPGIYRLLVRVKVNRVLPQIFYIGQSKHLRNRLLEHFLRREGNRCIKRCLQYRCYFQFVKLKSDDDLLTIEREQIQKYKPPGNVVDHPIVGMWRNPSFNYSPLVRVRHIVCKCAFIRRSPRSRYRSPA